MRPCEGASNQLGMPKTANTVGVIDDDKAVLESFQFMLELAGFSVITYGSAVAYLAARDARPSCLILDHHMPEMTGLELASELRSSGSEIPILLITAAPSPDLIARAAAYGVERVLTKPPPEEDVLAFVSARRGAPSIGLPGCAKGGTAPPLRKP
jgi:two-component system response regulator FixJ